MTSPVPPAPRTGLRFAKGHGTENDFVLLADPDGSLDLGPDAVRALTDRRAGIGGDGILRAVPSAALPEGRRVLADEPAAHWFMDYRNADGSVAEMCGNGVRVFTAFLLEQGLVELPAEGELAIGTRAGVRRVRRVPAGHAVRGSTGAGTGDWFVVDMGRWHLPGGEEAARTGSDAVVTVAGLPGSRPALGVDVGNPHRVLALAGLDELESADLTQLPVVEPLPADGANIELVVPLGEEVGSDGVRRGRIRMRVHERGVGETRSCGTGACAAALAVRTWAGAGAPDEWVVEVPGGRLVVTVLEGGGVLLAGPAVIVGDGVLRPATAS